MVTEIAERSWSVFQWKRHAASIAGRDVHGAEQFQRAKTLAAIRIRFAMSTEHVDHVFVVKQMTGAVDRLVHITALARQIVVGVGAVKFPMVHLIHRHAADPDSSTLTQNSD